MLAALLMLQVAAGAPVRGDSIRADSARRAQLEHVLDAAAKARAASPGPYRAHVETEVAVLLRPRDTSAVEQLARVEQVASDLQWCGRRAVEQRVVGYRVGASAVAPGTPAEVSSLSWLRQPWVVPNPGDALRILSVWSDGALLPSGRSMRAVAHPLADDRRVEYRFAGGDTVETTTPGGARILVVRVHVMPRDDTRPATLRFRGDMDLEVATLQLVRLRGEMVAPPEHPSRWQRLVQRGLRTVEWVDFTSERTPDGRWLPAVQRLEVHGRSPLARDFRPVVRVVSYVRDYAAAAGCRRTKRRDGHLTLAARDTLRRFDSWRFVPGEVSAHLRTADFDDIAARDTVNTAHATCVMRSDSLTHAVVQDAGDSPHAVDARVPGRLRQTYQRVAADAEQVKVPGLAVRADVGRMWSEGVARGGLGIEWSRLAWRSSLQLERGILGSRSLLPVPGTGGTTVVMRLDDDGDASARSRLLWHAGAPGSLRDDDGLQLRLDVRPVEGGRGAMAMRALAEGRGLGGDAAGPPADEAELLGALSLVMRPHVVDATRASGIGVVLSLEHDGGAVLWQRLGARMVARHSGEAITWTARLEGATLDGRLVRRFDDPVLSSVDLASARLASGVGDRSAGRARVSAAYHLTTLATPLRSLHWLYLAGGVPAVELSMEGDWRDARRWARQEDAVAPAAGWLAIVRRQERARDLGASVLLRPFGGSLGLGVSRSVVRDEAWRVVLSTDPWW